MTDLTRYRMEPSNASDHDHVCNDVTGCYRLVPDDSLQQIADAWKRYNADLNNMATFQDLADLLDGLVNEVAPDQDPNHPNYMGEPLKDTNLSNTEMSEETALYLDGLEGEPT